MEEPNTDNSSPSTSIETAQDEIPQFTFGGYGGSQHDIVGVGFWPRAGARVIDTLLHIGVSFCAGVIFVVFFMIASAGNPDRALLARMQHTDMYSFLFALLGSVAYHSICEGLHGSSLGKRILSMTVVQEDGRPCTMVAAIIRSLGYFVDALFFGFVGYFAMQETVKEQRHGDKWAKTVVCRLSDVVPESRRRTGRFLAALVLACMADMAFIMTGLLLKIVG